MEASGLNDKKNHAQHKNKTCNETSSGCIKAVIKYGMSINVIAPQRLNN